jgi:hypothetical protein
MLSGLLGEHAWRKSGLGAPFDLDELKQQNADLEQRVADLRLQFDERDQDLAAGRSANRPVSPGEPHCARTMLPPFPVTADTFDFAVERFAVAPGETVPVYSAARAVVDAMRLGRPEGRSPALSALNRSLRSTGQQGVADLQWAPRELLADAKPGCVYLAVITRLDTRTCDRTAWGVRGDAAAWLVLEGVGLVDRVDVLT